MAGTPDSFRRLLNAFDERSAQMQEAANRNQRMRQRLAREGVGPADLANYLDEKEAKLNALEKRKENASAQLLAAEQELNRLTGDMSEEDLAKLNCLTEGMGEEDLGSASAVVCHRPKSPRICSPHSTTKDVMSSPPAPPLRYPPQPDLSPSHDYNFSSTAYDESSAPPTDHEDAYATTDDKTAHLAPGAETTSGRSSTSSPPASVAASAMVPPPDKLITPTGSPSGLGHMGSGSGLGPTYAVSAGQG